MTKIHPPERSSPAEKKGITMKDTALAFIKKYPYAVSFGEINFGPSSSAFSRIGAVPLMGYYPSATSLLLLPDS